MTLSATAEAVGITAALRRRRTRQQLASEARAASSSCGSPREASRGQHMHPEDHEVVEHMIDGLRATVLVGSQRLMPMWWSADLTTTVYTHLLCL